jgi:hypothetical protein
MLAAHHDSIRFGPKGDQLSSLGSTAIRPNVVHSQQLRGFTVNTLRSGLRKQLHLASTFSNMRPYAAGLVCGGKPTKQLLP